MTLDELNLHFDAVDQLNSARERLMSMTSFLKAQSLDGMPRSSSAGRKVEQLAVLVQQQEETVARMEKIVRKSEKEVRDFISTIHDNRTAQIFSLRFLCGFEWGAVASIIGGKNTEEAVKAVCYRYLQVH
jgi:nitrate reductase beta subunit